ncbi:hypothetical protein FR932_08285 [Moritella marina ATCC 15381]|uniref:Uncharacterized protein n=1 Tax=Moritella marina ATCC 15381 TaxID=1202962 RepID=A0A5J6WKN8_MORMI|nr:YdbH domain-containing protein [Moritella marina]QFI37848.1 hypothetical protein FR932_08285 [Moritella marina ATCC 15381]
MSTPQQAKKASFHLGRWILGVSTLMMLSVAISFSYRENIIIQVSNHFANNHGIKVEQLTGLVMTFDLKQPWFIESITLANVDLSIDYLQFQRATQVQATDGELNTTALIMPVLPDWVPDLHITNITVRGDNLPDFAEDKIQSWSSLQLNTLDVKNIVFRYNDAAPEFGFSVWQQDQQLLTAQFHYTTDQLSDKTDPLNGKSKEGDSHKQLHALLLTDLAKTKPIMNLLLPEFTGLLSGFIKLELAFNPENIDRIAVSVWLNDGELKKAQQALITNANLTLTTELTLADNTWLADTVDLTLGSMEPITVSADNCALFGSFIDMTSSVCQPFLQTESSHKTKSFLQSKLTPVTITPKLPLGLQLSIQERDINNWQITAQQLATAISMSDNKLALQVDKLLLTPQFLQTAWAMTVDGNSRYINVVDGLAPMPIQVAAQGYAKIDLTSKVLPIELFVKRAKITAQQFEYTDMSSDNITVELLAPTSVNIKDNKLLPFTSAFATNSYNNQYQQAYKISRLTAQHKVDFNSKALTLNSDWQLDDTALKSKNTLSLLGLAPTKATGSWLVPAQSIPAFVTHANPLPKGLDISPLVTNRLNYTLNLNEKRPYLTATVKGELTADSVNFKDILASELQTNWRCNMDSKDADIATSLMARCTIGGNVATINIGPVVDNIAVSGLVSLVGGQVQVAVDNASAEIFSGQVSVLPLLITDFDHIVGQIQVRNLSLPEAVELYQVPGVNVTGLLKADLPFVLQGSAVSITDGVIEGQAQGGIIQIKDNVTIDQLKLTQPQLRYALELLENLHYDHLHSDVDFKPSGETKLLISIKGRNPSVERPIEFNYSHEENILQLFRSLRINDSMYDALDKMNNP